MSLVPARLPRCQEHGGVTRSNSTRQAQINAIESTRTTSIEVNGVRVAIDDHRLWQLLGIITLALPISIIGGSFIDERSQMLEREAAEDLKSRNTIPKTAVSCCDRPLAINMLCSTRKEVKNYCSLSRGWKIHWKEWTTATMS